MLALLVALSLSQDMCVMDEGTLKACSVRTVNCSGSGITCTIDKGKWKLSVSGSGPQCNGGAATNLQINGGGTCSNFGGAACGASNFATQISASGALTCSIPPGTCSGGSVSGSLGSVQYNGNGSCSGLTNVLGDGTRLEVIAETAHPSAPSTADHTKDYNFVAATGMPPLPMHISNTLGIPIPDGMEWQFSQLGTAANWRTASCLPQGFGSANVNMFGQQTAVTTCTAAGGSCTATLQNWASTNLETMSPVVQGVTTNASNIWCGYLIGGKVMWRGNTAGRGGFVFYNRSFVDQAADDGLATHRIFIGLINASSILAGTTQPRTSALMTDFVGFAGNTGETSLFVCDNDNVSTPTCSGLGSNFPTSTGAWYDFWIWAYPNDTHIYYAVQRLDSAQTASGEFDTSDLPRNTVQLGWQTLMGTGTGSDAGILKYTFGGSTWALNY